jgi:hypothetical protein
MYLVEIETGREQLYQSAEALGAAIRAGVIRSESKIFHRASERWISITLHPEYQKALAAIQEPLPPLARSHWTFFGNELPARAVANHPEATASEPKAQPQPARRGIRALLGRARRQPSPETPEKSGS